MYAKNFLIPNISCCKPREEDEYLYQTYNDRESTEVKLTLTFPYFEKCPPPLSLNVKIKKNLQIDED